jgi:NADH-quinone oxidoreductase subunit H
MRRPRNRSLSGENSEQENRSNSNQNDCNKGGPPVRTNSRCFHGVEGTGATSTQQWVVRTDCSDPAGSLREVETVIKLVVLGAVVPLSAAVVGYTFLLKTMAHMQQRLGPMEAGPHGVLQLVADGLKFIQKEDIIPAKADRLVFGLAPIVTLVATFLVFVVIPAGPNLIVEDLDIGVIFIMAVSAIATIGVLMAGWGSASKFSLLGGLRAAAQLVAYEVPLVLAVIGVVIQAGSMSLQHIVGAQMDSLWFVIPQILGFAVFLVAAQAELAQTPFDMPVAVTEVVAGYMTEYSGFRFLLFYVSELATAVGLAALAATLYLGGWQLPFVELHGTAAAIAGPFILGAKIMLIAFLIFWVRFSFPRLREDQLQALAWKALIPISLVNLVLTAVFKVAF